MLIRHPGQRGHLGPDRTAPASPAVTNEVQQAREALAYRLRDIRLDARMSGRQLAALTGWHFTKISKIEHGRSMPTEADIELWCFHCGAESQIPDLTATVRGIERLYAELKRLLRTGTSRYQQEVLDQEGKSRHIRVFDPAIIPGALQTPGYATARFAEFTDMVGIPSDVPAAVAVRMERGNLIRSGERLFHIVVGEHALHVAFAEPDVMAEQLLHLRGMLNIPGLRLGIVPTRARHYMTLGGFWIFDDREVQVETYSAAIRITQPREVAMYTKVFDHYAKCALYGQRARNLIDQALNGSRESLMPSNSRKLH
jgi:transcriptional regulator with XRE-family HTH domain